MSLLSSCGAQETELLLQERSFRQVSGTNLVTESPINKSFFPFSVSRNRSCCSGSGVLVNGQLKTGNSDAQAWGSHKPNTTAHSPQIIVEDDAGLPKRIYHIVSRVICRTRLPVALLHCNAAEMDTMLHRGTDCVCTCVCSFCSCSLCIPVLEKHVFCTYSGHAFVMVAHEIHTKSCVAGSRGAVKPLQGLVHESRGFRSLRFGGIRMLRPAHQPGVTVLGVPHTRHPTVPPCVSQHGPPSMERQSLAYCNALQFQQKRGRRLLFLRPRQGPKATMGVLPNGLPHKCSLRSSSRGRLTLCSMFDVHYAAGNSTPCESRCTCLQPYRMRIDSLFQIQQ